ncbi:MAG: sporulation transcription factor Spo0A [Clostridiales bacterium]|nr:sporulation transcription factor Spo0A [Clostridiales bacterium]
MDADERRSEHVGDIKVMLVDDNAELRRAMKTAMDRQEGILVAAECASGLEALERLGKTQVDVIVLDIIMPQMDGYSFLEEMNRLALEHPPQVIVVSALGRDDFIMRAVDLGARYYMVKPIEITALIARIREVCGRGALLPETGRLPHTGHVPTMDEKLAGLFLTIGIPAHIKGYAFLREAVKMVVENPDVINRITKELYPGIGKRFNTSASKVERAIRHAIEVAWSRGRIDTLNKAFGCKVATKEDKPTNGEFIAMIADKLALEQRSA